MQTNDSYICFSNEHPASRSAVDRFTSAAHAFKSLLLKNTGLEAHDDGDAPLQANVMSSAEQDLATRERLLATAARLFADHGYAHVTIRDICGAAHANIAAVNYHFAGKAGLYDEVVHMAIRTMQEVTAEAARVGQRKNAEERLRAYIHVFLTRVAAVDADGWIHHIMLREISEPTAALDRIVDDVVRPRMAYLRTIAAELIGCPADDARAARCAFSIHAQCIAMMNTAIAERLNPAHVGPDAIESMVDHITEFSLAGLWALARTT
jgi:AcrR family transcriptional regulator